MKKVIALLLSMAMAGSLAACSSSGSSSSAAAVSESSAIRTASLASTGASSGHYSIGVLFTDTTDPIFAEVSTVLTEMGKKEGWDVTVLDCKNNSQTQITQVENLVEKGVDTIVIYPNDEAALESVCTDAHNKGVKIISWDTELKCSDMAYLVKNYDVGYAIGTQAANWIKEKYNGSCEVAVLDYAVIPVIVERAKGIIDAIHKITPDAKIVAQDSAVDAAKGMALSENMLEAHPNIKVFACIGDGGAVGANETLKAKGVKLDDYGIFGCDASKEACTAIANNEAIRMSISLGTAVDMAKTAFNMIETVKAGGKFNKEVYKVATPVTAKNVSNFYSGK